MSATEEKTTVLIIDDHPVIGSGMRSVLEQYPEEFVVAGQAATLEDAYDKISSLSPRIALTDLMLGNEYAFSLIYHTLIHHPGTKIVAMSMQGDFFYVERAFRSGAYGYINKGEDIQRLVDVLRLIVRGKSAVPPDTIPLLYPVIASTLTEGDIFSPRLVLDEEEWDVFSMTGQGLGINDIASQLGTTRERIIHVRSRIKHILRIPDSATLNRRAVEWMIHS